MFAQTYFISVFSDARMTNPAHFQGLVEAAFAHALSTETRASFFKEVVPGFRRSSPSHDFADALVPRPQVPKGRAVHPRRRVRVRERSDGTGLAFVWRIDTGTTRTIAAWTDLTDLQCPKEADPVAVAFVRHMAATIWTKATTDFEHEIQAGRVALMGRLGSPFEERRLIPGAALAHLQINDWLLGTGDAAGSRLFDLVVVPELDESAAYLAKVRAAGRVWTKLLPVLVTKLYPTGLPPRTALSDRDFGDAMERELIRLKVSPLPSPKAYDRVRKSIETTTR